MPSIGLCFFFLGVVVVSVTAIETTTGNGFPTASTTENLSATVTPVRITTATSTNNATANGTMSSNTSLPSTTEQPGGASTMSVNETQSSSAITPTIPTITTTTKSNMLSKSTTTIKTTTKTIKNTRTTVKPKKSTAVDKTGLIILIVIILIALGFGVACFFFRKRGRQASVDFTSRPDESNIPLRTMEPDLPIDAVPQNGLRTFESAAKEPQEPEAKPGIPEEQKAEADKPVVESAADKPVVDSAAPAPTPDGSEDKPEEPVVEQSPPEPVEPSVEAKADDDGVTSNETAVESLKEANENNSNNADCSQTRDINFWDVPLNCPV